MVSHAVGYGEYPENAEEDDKCETEDEWRWPSDTQAQGQNGGGDAGKGQRPVHRLQPGRPGPLHHPDLPDTNHQAIAHFVSHGFAGSIFGMLARVASKHSGCANPRLMVSGQSR
jgi:hypothetical protein